MKANSFQKRKQLHVCQLYINARKRKLPNLHYAQCSKD